MKKFFYYLWLAVLYAGLLAPAAAQEEKAATDEAALMPTQSVSNTEAAISAPLRFLPSPPQSLTLCGEKVPLGDPFIYEQLDREFNSLVHDQAQVVMYLKRAGRYFPYISRELKAAGLPDDLKYVAVAESNLLYYIRSKAGALGLWQFMPATAQRFNLKINDVMDERLNPEKSTQAAMDYLKYLYKMFNNWALSMAAYNCGEGKVAAELKDQDVNSYYELYLPRETMRYVYRIMAIKVILSNPRAYGYLLADTQIYAPQQSDETVLVLDRSISLRELAAYSKSSVRCLRELNPELLTNTLPRGSYRLLVPKGQGGNMLSQLKQEQAPKIPAPHQPQQPAMEWVVKPGDTLNALAKRFGVNAQVIIEANKLNSKNLKAGQKLIIPGNEK